MPPLWRAGAGRAGEVFRVDDATLAAIDRLERLAGLDGDRRVVVEWEQAGTPGEPMEKRLSTIERTIALVLALVWTAGGATAMVFAWPPGDWLRVALAVFAVLYGITWLRVVLLGRALRWQESLGF